MFSFPPTFLEAISYASRKRKSAENSVIVRRVSTPLVNIENKIRECFPFWETGQLLRNRVLGDENYPSTIERTRNELSILLYRIIKSILQRYRPCSLARRSVTKTRVDVWLKDLSSNGLERNEKFARNVARTYSASTWKPFARSARDICS